MTHKLMIFILLIASAGLFGCASERYAQNNKDRSMRGDTLKMMKQEDIIALSKAGVSDSLIISMMDASDTWFQLKTQDVINLRNAGVSEKVIGAMMEQPAEPSNKKNSSTEIRYYAYPPYYWYGWYDPFWYYPSFSVRLGYRSYYPMHFHHGRFH